MPADHPLRDRLLRLPLHGRKRTLLADDYFEHIASAAISFGIAR
jgi:hypothetical protein